MSHMNEDVSANSIPDVTSLNNLSLQPPTQAPQAPPSNPSYSQPAHSPPPSYNYPSSPTPSYQQPPPQPQYQQQPPPQYTAAPIQAPSANSVVTNRPPSYPGQSRAPPLSNTDPRVKDAVEICNFAISALKVSPSICLSLTCGYSLD